MLSQETLGLLVAGTTHVLERNGKEAYVYFETNGASHMLLDDGEARSGRWHLDEGGYTAQWNTGATGRWIIEGEPGKLTYVNRDSAARVRMLGVLFGNPKGLPRQG